MARRWSRGGTGIGVNLIAQDDERQPYLISMRSLGLILCDFDSLRDYYHKERKNLGAGFARKHQERRPLSEIAETAESFSVFDAAPRAYPQCLVAVVAS